MNTLLIPAFNSVNLDLKSQGTTTSDQAEFSSTVVCTTTIPIFSLVRIWEFTRVLDEASMLQ